MKRKFVYSYLRLVNGEMVKKINWSHFAPSEIPGSGAEKNFTQKTSFYTQKHQKNSMSKNGVQSRLTLLFKEL